MAVEGEKEQDGPHSCFLYSAIEAVRPGVHCVPRFMPVVKRDQETSKLLNLYLVSNPTWRLNHPSGSKPKSCGRKSEEHTKQRRRGASDDCRLSPGK